MKSGYQSKTQKAKYDKTCIQMDVNTKKDNNAKTILSNEPNTTTFEIPNQNN